MALTTPILRAITTALDATKEYTFLFDNYGGDQISQHNIVIQNNNTGAEIYNQTVSSFQSKSILAASTLTQNIQYRIKIRIGNINNGWSEFSSWVVFWCFAPAVLTIPTVVGGIVYNQNVLFTGTYTQQYDQIQAYFFNLYGYDNVLLETSPLIYTSDASSISCMFTGLKNNTYYKIELRTLSVHNTEVSSGLFIFLPTYISPTLNSSVTLTSLEEQGLVQVDSQIVQIIGTGVDFSYEDSDWVNITATNGLISFKEGMTFTSDFTLKIWIKNIPIKVTFVKLLADNGDIQLQYYNNRFHCFKTSNKIISHYVNLNDIAVDSNNVVCVMLRQINDEIDIDAQIIS